LRDSVDEWHRRNLNQLVTGTLSSNTTLFSVAVPKSSTYTNSNRIVPTPRIETEQNPIYHLSAQDHIAALESEIFAICIQPDNLPSRVPIQAMPEHLFHNAWDTTHIPHKAPKPSKELPPVPKKSDIAYRTLPAIHNPDIAETVYNWALDANFTLLYHKLLSLSPKVQSQVCNAVSSKHVPTKDNVKVVRANTNIVQDEPLSEEELSYLYADEELVPFKEEHRSLILTFTNRTSVKTQPPNNTIIIDDPIDCYYCGLAPGEAPKYDCLIIVKESSALRLIIPLIDNNMKVESILDPGCQIIAMSEDCCHELGLPFNPTIVVNMQSANGIIDPSLGLSQNVPFLIGPLTFHMQVHIILLTIFF
jgi:hypothetical protein